MKSILLIIFLMPLTVIGQDYYYHNGILETMPGRDLHFENYPDTIPILKNQFGTSKKRVIRLSGDTLSGRFIEESGDTLVFDVPIYIDSVEKNYDTVKVLLLVCDTATQIIKVTKDIYDTSGHWINHTYSLIDKKVNVSNNAYWQYGYEVRERSYDGYTINGNVMLHVEYLDIIKNKLSRNIIVWQSKNN